MTDATTKISAKIISKNRIMYQYMGIKNLNPLDSGFKGVFSLFSVQIPCIVPHIRFFQSIFRTLCFPALPVL